MNRKSFQLEKQISIKEAKSKNLNRSHKARMRKTTSSKSSLARPNFIAHNCINHGGESNCSICRTWINKNSRWKP